MIKIIVFSLFVLSIVLFFADGSYFYISIILFTLSFLIVLINAMWSFSVTATDKLHQFFDDK